MDRSVAASERRLRAARGAGQEAFSPMLSASAALLAALTAASIVAGPVRERFLALMRRAVSTGVETAGTDPAAVDSIGREAAAAFAWATLPILVAALAGAIIAGLVQTRGLVAWGAARGGGAAAAAGRERRRGRVLDGIAAVALAAGALVVALRGEGAALRAVVAPSGSEPIAQAVALLGRVTARAGVLLLVCGAVAWAGRRWSLARALRMTRAEAAAERREDEGDPRLRAERRRRAR